MLIAIPDPVVEIERVFGRERDEMAKHKKGVCIIILVLAWDLTPDDSRDVLWARTSKSRIDDLQQLMCVAIRVRDNQLESRSFLILIFNVALLNLFKAPA